MALPAGDELQQRLLAYLDLLHKWNQAYNLSAVREPQQMLYQHLLDCLAVLPSLDRHLQEGRARILDVGSGAGLPGVVWALMRPGWALCCVDAVAKKASFVRQVAADQRGARVGRDDGGARVIRALGAVDLGDEARLVPGEHARHGEQADHVAPVLAGRDGRLGRRLPDDKHRHAAARLAGR